MNHFNKIIKYFITKIIKIQFKKYQLDFKI